MIVQLWRLIYKIFFCVILVIFYALFSSITLIIPLEKYKKKNILAYLNSFTSWGMIRILNISTRFLGTENYDESKSWFIMGNHVSFVDVFLVVARFRTLLITSTEMKKRAVLGQLAVLGGCLFVERRKITTLRDEIPEISGAFNRKLNVCLFPESTCSDGRGLLPFKSALMSAVSGTPALILPVCVMYRKINGENFTPDDFKRIGYFGGMKFFPQFMKVMMLKSLEVELEMLEPVDPGSLDRKEISALVFEKINLRYTRYLAGISPAQQNL
jgi:lyso-ornithine lipid O-acyltransferase